MIKGQEEIKHLLLTRFRMRQLVAYIAVYEHRNIQAAARGVTPAPAADILYQHARQIVNQCSRTAAELSQITAQKATHIVIGCVSYLDTVAVKAIARFKALQ
jgi:DNA-binding transcriptional LysR family regulator